MLKDLICGTRNTRSPVNVANQDAQTGQSPGAIESKGMVQVCGLSRTMCGDARHSVLVCAHLLCGVDLLKLIALDDEAGYNLCALSALAQDPRHPYHINMVSEQVRTAL